MDDRHTHTARGFLGKTRKQGNPDNECSLGSLGSRGLLDGNAALASVESERRVNVGRGTRIQSETVFMRKDLNKL